MISSEKTFSFVTRPDERSAEITQRVRERLTEAHWREDPVHPARVIVIGGDGTFIYAVHKYIFRLSRLALVGIHSGTLGFFMDYQDTELDTFVEDLTGERMPVETFPILEAQTDIGVFFAMNEVRIENPTRTQTLDVTLNGEYFEQFRGSGFCLSTQMGSTALNRSLGGAVLQKGLPALQLTEIAGIHHAKFRSLGTPFVISDDTVVQLTSDSCVGAVLGTDSTVNDMRDVHTVTIRKSPTLWLNILRRRNLSYLDRLTKLF